MSGWGDDWEDRKRGRDCVLCPYRDIDSNDWGVRIYAGRWANAFLWAPGQVRGYVVCIWTGPHVAEITDLNSEQAAGYWSDLTSVARAVDRTFKPTKLNLATLGNGVPHLHTHVVPRYSDDPYPGGPLPWSYLETGRRTVDELAADAHALGAHVHE